METDPISNSVEPTRTTPLSYPDDEVAALDEPHPEPLTIALLTRLFGVPLLIVALIVSGATTVVLLFGAPSSPHPRSVETLLRAMEHLPGPKRMGMLLPQDRETWQAGLELTLLLGTEAVSDAERLHVVERLTTMLEDDLAGLDTPSVDSSDPKPGFSGPTRLDFVIRALGRGRRPEAIDPLISVVQDGPRPYANAAIQELANLRGMEGVERAIDPILSMLGAESDATTRITVCTALSALAPSGHPKAIKALNDVRLADDGEVSWAASLALTRLGSTLGKSTLLDLLDREFWTSDDRYQVIQDGIVHRYPMPVNRAESIMMAAIESTVGLLDEDTVKALHELESDSSPAIRGKAAEVLRGRP